MDARDAVVRGVEVTVLLAVLAVLVGQVLGQPVLLAFVETGSMEPTMEPGDGFVAIPPAVAGPVEEGDVVTFRAKQIHGGGLTTHRVVGRTAEGYVTQGDANLFTDQQGEEPPVKEEQIVAVAWQVGGHVVVIPALGSVVGGTQDAFASVQRTLAVLLGTRALLGAQGLAYLLFAVSAIAYAVDWYLESNTRRRERSRSRSRDAGLDPRLVVGILAAAVVLAATAAMVGPSGAQEFTFESVENPERGGIATGDSVEVNFTLVNGGVVPSVSYLEADADHVSVESSPVKIPARGQTNATVRLTAPQEPGSYRRYVAHQRYLAVLPTPVISWLHGFHPWVPVVVIDALLGAAFYLLGIALVGSGRIRSRPRASSRRDWLG